MLRRLAEDPRTAMRAFMEALAEPQTVAADRAMRAGADLLDVRLVLDGPVKRFASAAAAAPAAPAEEQEEVREHLIGESIGSYRIEALLGSGVTSRVYRARHEVFDRAYALKVLHGKLKGRQPHLPSHRTRAASTRPREQGPRAPAPRARTRRSTPPPAPTARRRLEHIPNPKLSSVFPQGRNTS
jgi:serine/threonine protein kinase